MLYAGGYIDRANYKIDGGAQNVSDRFCLAQENRMKIAATVLSALLSLPLMANADTYTQYDISGTDSQRQQSLDIGQSGCKQLVCVPYAPGTFSGTALVDTSTSTFSAAFITTCCSSFSESYTLSALTPNLGLGLNLVLPIISYANLGYQPLLNLVFDLSNDSVSGSVFGPTASIGPGIDQVGATYTLDMVGTLTPEITTTIPPTAAPEIDPASTASGVTLLLGSLLVLRGLSARKLS